MGKFDTPTQNKERKTFQNLKLIRLIKCVGEIFFKNEGHCAREQSQGYQLQQKPGRNSSTRDRNPRA